jgi:DNA polymerase III alpha subunit
MGLRYVKGLREETGKKIQAGQAGRARFASIDGLVRQAGLRQDEVRMLAEVGALASFGGDRRTALWQAERAGRPAGPLLGDDVGDVDVGDLGDGDPPPAVRRPSPAVGPLSPMSMVERVQADYDGMGLTIGPHPMALVFNGFELLYVAKQVAAALAASGYRPPLPAHAVTVAGDVGTATLKMALVNMLEGRFISAHDDVIASRIADVLCGGDIERGSQVDEQWLLDLERRHFFELAQMPKTQERIAHTLATGKPLRN